MPGEEFTSEVSENNYGADNIQKLEGLEAVRMRPAMYIGDTGSRGLHHLFTEVVDNSIDEHLAGYCSEIKVILGADNTVTVVDNGRGIPTGWKADYNMSAMELVLTNLHAGGKFDGGGYKVSGGLHGVGVSCVNALSEWMEVWVKREGKEVYQRYERGVNVSGALKVLREDLDESDTGTVVKYYSDKEIFGDIVYDPSVFKTRLRELAFLNKGLKIVFVNELPYDSLSELRKKHESVRKEETEDTELDLSDDFENDEGKDELIPAVQEVKTARTSVFYYEKGIIEFIEYLNKNKTILHVPVYFEAYKDKVEVEIAFQYNDTFREDILSYVNNIHTQEGGTHLTGFRTALTRVINNYGRANNIIKEKEKNLSGDDIKEGLCAIVSCKIEDPQFEGQTKTKLGNSEVAGIVTNIVSENLTIFMEENPQSARRIIEKCLTAQRAREAARKAAELVKRSGAMDTFSLPGKLSDCNEKDPSKCELFIVEGQSAGGSAKSGRDRRTQAILPLRGKIL
ncbi:MAG: DNA topoisomerase IV subunit B, partial [Armatimonadetes bacterium]|nr:DNA topoisomerase IV subunit B [Candidatus Hippobium faecium]